MTTRSKPKVADKKEVRFFSGAIEIRSGTQEGDEKRTIGGYVVKWNQRSHLIWGEFYEKVAQGAFARSLKENTIKALWNHRTDFVLGSMKPATLRLWEDDIGLAFEIDLPNNSWGNDAWESIQRRDVDGMSFGFWTRADSWQYLEEEDVYERTLLDVNCFEVSPTPFPAYEDSEVDVRSRMAESGVSTREERQRQRSEKEKLRFELDLLEIA